MPSKLSDRSDGGSVVSEAVQAVHKRTVTPVTPEDEIGLPKGLKFRTELIAFLKRIEKFSQNWARWTVTKARNVSNAKRARRMGSKSQRVKA